MLSLLSLLQTRRDWPGQTLADRLGVTSRTVRRDVDRLRELGYRIAATKGPDGGYRLDAGSELPPLLFDDEQAVAIAVALQSAASSGVDISEASERALATVRQVMPSRLRHRIDGIRFSSATGGERVDPAVIEAVSAAVRDRLTLRFDYGAGDADDERDAGPARRTEPHGLVARNARWYLVAWDLDRGDWRVFRLDRMSPRVPTGPRFAPRSVPTGDAGSFVDARAKGSDAGRWPCIGRVELDLPARAVAPWMEDGQVEPITEGTSRVTLGSWSWAGLLAQVLRFDAPFRIVDPPELRAAARELAGRLGSA
jgi:predicted DNA-binding transcriptional regulator YafY